MELLRDMALLPVAGAIPLLPAIIGVVFGAVGVLLVLAMTLGGPVMVVWGATMVASGNTLVGIAGLSTGLLFWILVAAQADIEVTDGEMTIE